VQKRDDTFRLSDGRTQGVHEKPMGKKSGKFKYVADYEKNGTGDYIYTGQYYFLECSGSELRRMKIGYAAFSAAIVVFYAFAGFLNTAGGHVVYVVLPYVLLFLPTVLMIADVYKFITGNVKMTRKQYDHSFGQLNKATLAIEILAGLCTVCETIYVSLHPAKNELFFLGSCILMFAASVGFNFMQKRTKRIIVLKPQ
jgi:hypothetical protein